MPWGNCVVLNAAWAGLPSGSTTGRAKSAGGLKAMPSEFISAAARLGLPVDPVSGVELQKLVDDMAKTPPDVIKTFHEVVGSDF